jgi:PAS domain-containing protein
MSQDEGGEPPPEPAARDPRPGAPSRLLETVSVPEALAPVFLAAQGYVEHYFGSRIEDPTRAAIQIGDERYILVRASAMSVEFFDLVASMYRDRGEDEARRVAENLLFDVAHSLGRADARAFHARVGVDDPIARLSTGPIHFAYAGWAFVKILPESAPVPTEDFLLIYEHPFSFESDAWLRRGRRSRTPVCIMNAGYSSGWCEESFGLPLAAAEIECLARGDARCRFVMAPPSRIEAHLNRLQASAPRAWRPDRPQVNVPEYFQRKRLEDALRESHRELEIGVLRRTAQLQEINEALQREIQERLRIERALRESESRFRRVVESNMIGIAFWRADGVFTDANDYFLAMTGYDAA